MTPERHFLIAESSLLDILRKARYSGDDEEALVNELEGRNEIEEVDIG